MANFKPINAYSYFLLDKLILKYKIKPPFLDVGCGVGDLSVFLARKDWAGKSIDYSADAVSTAKRKLKAFRLVNIQKDDFLKSKSRYNSVFMWDVIEHFDNDMEALDKAYRVLNNLGFLIMAVPSNPHEWRWDDEFYGHFRRYSPKGMKDKLQKAGFDLIEVWDITFPFFWIMRRIYTSFKKPPVIQKDKIARTMKSSTTVAWKVPFISEILNNTSFLWMPVYIIQYLFFRHRIYQGFSFIILAKKRKV